MAAYAALLSLTNILHDLQNHHSPPISIDPQQLQSLSQILTFLLEFLENSKSPVADDDDEADPFKMRIVDAAYAVEDVIESHLVNVINPTSLSAKIARFFNCFKAFKFHEDLQQVIEEMDLIKHMYMEMNTEKALAVHTHNASVSAFPIRSPSFSSTDMVCSDFVLTRLMDKLVGGRLDREIIPIVGMGGIGKTTLALNIYERKTIKEHFVVCAWITISQKYDTRELLCEVLAQVTNKKKENIGVKSENEVKEELYKYLFGRRFLIVMDDMWSIDAWEKIHRYFPDNNNGSWIMVTTRLWKLSSQLNPNFSLQMEFLDEASSWDLFSKTVFGEKIFPQELKKIGEKIVANCRGLPLSIVVVGGLLKNMANSRECWESIRENLTSVVNSENDKHCLRLLKLSYHHLPVHLKRAFCTWDCLKKTMKLECQYSSTYGFLKPMNDKNLKTVAMGLLKDLVDRNLILIHRIGSTGNIKSCKIHDLLRDLCLKEGEKEGFYHVIGQSQGMKRQCRRIVIPKNTSNEEVVESLQSIPHVRSIICENGNVPAFQNFGYLRTFRYVKNYIDATVIRNVNLRHLAIKVHSMSTNFNSLNLFWNLHTLIVSSDDNESTMHAEIWKMRQLRHIELPKSHDFPPFRHLVFPESVVRLPDPPPSKKDGDVIMENLQVIKGVKNFKCSEEVVKRIPNLKKLEIHYREFKGWSSFHDDDYFCVSNFQFLSKLEHFSISFPDLYLHKLSFPNSLKRLTLNVNNEFEWEDIIEKIGTLPYLEKLVLRNGWFRSGKWEMVEGQFQALRYLQLYDVCCLEQWIVEDSSVLPRLERLSLDGVNMLEEFPIEIGNITTLQKVELWACNKAMVRSARTMVDEQVEVQGDQLPFHVHVGVCLWGYEREMVDEQVEVQGDQPSFHIHVDTRLKDKETLERLATPNFKVEVWLSV